MAGKIACPNCKATIYSNLHFCPKCGEKIYIHNFRDENLGDLYKILQVDPSAEQEVIEAAYKRLATKYHPDLNKSADAQTRMQDINKAYKILSKLETRRQYDLTRGSQPDQTEKQKQEQPKEKVQERKAQSQTRPRKPIVTKPKPNQPIKSLVIVIAILAGVVWCVSLFSVPATTTQSKSLPTITRRPTARPTDIPTRVHNPTPIRSGPDCIIWNRIIRSQVGKRVCGYGLVVDVYPAAEYIQIISFSEIEGAFIIKGKKYYFEDVKPGDCIVFEGKVYESSYSLFLSIDDTDIKLGSLDSGDRLYSSCIKGK